MANLREPIIFEDLEPIEVPVKIGKTWYVLAEASYDAFIKYQNFNAGALKIDPETGKAVSFGGNAEGEARLLSMCLYFAEPNSPEGRVPRVKGPNGEPTDQPDRSKLVPEGLLKSWGARIVQPIYERLEEISAVLGGLNKPEAIRALIAKLQKRLAALDGSVDAAKNSSPATAQP